VLSKFGPCGGWCAFISNFCHWLSADICSHDSIHKTRSLTHPSFIPTRSQSQPVVDASAQTQDIPPIRTPSDEPVSDFQAQQTTETSRSPESAEGSFQRSTDIARTEPSSHARLALTSPDSSTTTTSSPASSVRPSDSTQHMNDSTVRSHVFSSNVSSSPPSSVPISSRSVNISRATVSA
jgi:hypothetical protein